MFYVSFCLGVFKNNAPERKAKTLYILYFKNELYNPNELFLNKHLRKDHGIDEKNFWFCKSVFSN